jgi:hypothetical protein
VTIKPLEDGQVCQDLRDAGPGYTSVHDDGTFLFSYPVPLSPAQLTQLLLLRVNDLDADEREAILIAVNRRVDELANVGECPLCGRSREVAA